MFHQRGLYRYQHPCLAFIKLIFVRCWDGEEPVQIIGSDTNHLARIISDTLDTDILIIDTNMKIVGSSFKYLNLYTDIRIGTIISTILIENRNVIVEDKTRLAGCRKCDQYRECKMSSFCRSTHKG